MFFPANWDFPQLHEVRIVVWYSGGTTTQMISIQYRARTYFEGSRLHDTGFQILPSTLVLIQEYQGCYIGR